MFINLLLSLSFFQIVTSNFSFRNVVVTCDARSPFVTTITANRLKPHLPIGQKCDVIAIHNSYIPTLHPDSVSEITDVNYLLLENDSIERIQPGAFKSSKIKQALSLKWNKLREIKRGVFNDVQVPFLFLSYNSISHIDHQAFDNMTNLEAIHLDHNRLPEIDPYWFKNTPRLTELNLQHNRIEAVFAYAFRRDSSISRINLSHNIIRNINRHAFARFKKLELLSLAYNQLDDLDMNWLKGVKVAVLDISHNKFRCLRYGLAEPFSINFIDGNPWTCACLEEIKKKKFGLFGEVNAPEAFRRCNIA